MSERIREQWNLPDELLQHTHYNANNDRLIPSAAVLRRVLLIYYKYTNQDHYELELLDDGKHFDNQPNDGIYGNYLCSNLYELHIQDVIIDVDWDTLAISYHILQAPVIYLPKVPEIMYPIHKFNIPDDKPIINWQIDEKADGCGVILLGRRPVLGQELEKIVWQKEFRSVNKELFTEEITTPLNHYHEYTLLVWAYVNDKQIDNRLNQASYSMEWCQFFVGDIVENENPLQLQNFPNPFFQGTMIKYRVLEKDHVCLKIIDVLGREIKTLVNQEQTPGDHYIWWDGKNKSGANVGSGVYFCHLTCRNRSETCKMLLAR
ncbi:T9SS type A sorting domain-containing protein [candidate division KSB1 bacterium]|nr:T9SS type A sorting domain-containing protein [candidate division KSB1 bacterium]